MSSIGVAVQRPRRAIATSTPVPFCCYFRPFSRSLAPLAPSEAAASAETGGKLIQSQFVCRKREAFKVGPVNGSSRAVAPQCNPRVLPRNRPVPAKTVGIRAAIRSQRCARERRKFSRHSHLRSIRAFALAAVRRRLSSAGQRYDTHKSMTSHLESRLQ